jgi:hypothetical protein
MKKPTSTSATGCPIFLENLEPRIAPAALAAPADTEYKAVTLGNPQLLTAGQGLSTADASGAYLLRIDKGQAMVFTTDLNGNNAFDANEITGIAAGDGLRMTIFADINGDIVTNLRSNGLLSDSDLDPSNDRSLVGGDGKVLLNSRIEALTLRSVTDTDLTTRDRALGVTAADRLVLSSYSIHGNILAGGGVGVAGGGILIDSAGLDAQVRKFGPQSSNYQLDTILPTIGSIRTGTAAASSPTPDSPFGQFFSFGYVTVGDDGERGQLLVGNNSFATQPGFLLPFIPQIGQNGGDIIGLQSGTIDPRTGDYANLNAFRIDAIITGDGGVGARGGDIINVVLYGDSGGLRIVAGDGGVGPSGGRGGSITNLQDLGSTNSLVEIRTGDGGDGLVGQAGAAGSVSFGRFEMNGEIYVGLGSGGSGFTSSGAGTSLLSATLRPTDINGTPTAVSVVSSYREVGQIATQSLADFNQDGYSDLIYLTHNPDQVIMKFGTALGIDDTTPTLYFAAPAFSPFTGDAGRSSGLVIQDFNGDGWLDFAVGSSVANSYGGIRAFLNPANGFAPATPDYNGWFEAAVAGGGENYIDSYVHNPVPFLNPYSQGGRIQRSGMPLTDMVAGNFDGDLAATVDLAVVLQTWKAVEIAADRPRLALLMLTGTGDGRFFADFDYTRDDGGVDTQQRMPLLNGGTAALPDLGQLSGDPGHHAVALRATAPLPGELAEIIVAAVLRNSDDRNVQVVQFGASPLVADYTSFQYIFRQAPTFFEPRFGQGSDIIGYNSRAGTPLDITITNFTGNFNDPALFDIVVINEDNGLTVMTPYAGYNTGITLTGRQGQIDVDGVTYTQPIDLLASRNDVRFEGALAGNFVTDILQSPTNFALYSIGTGLTPTAFYTFNFPGIRFILDTAGQPVIDPLTGLPTPRPGGEAMVNLVNAGIIAAPDPGDDFINTQMIAFDLFANSSLAASAIFGFVSANPTTSPQVFQGFQGVGLPFFYSGSTLVSGPLPVLYGLNVNAIQLVAGNGGDSFFGSGGLGGSIGTGKLQASPAVNAPPVGAFSVVLPINRYIQPDLRFTAGLGGDGFVNGGAGGNINGLVVSFADATVQTAVVRLAGGQGGDALIGRGGDGGKITEMSIQRGVNFFAGNAGRGFIGGNGGSVLGGGGLVYGPDTYSAVVFAVAGIGGQGIAAGGAGGAVNSFVAQYPPLIGGDAGNLAYTAGRGGSASSGTGGAGGGIRDSSPSSSPNNLAGVVLLAAGSGGAGLRGGAGGSIENFTNPSATDTPITVVSAVAGHGGDGITGAGGAGGSVSNFTVSGRGISTLVDAQFNRVLAGDGGDSFGAIGGRGGDLLTVTTTASNSAVAAVAGDGGAGLLAGGQGGSVKDSVVDATEGSRAAKVIVFAGHGGHAYAALAFAPGVALPAEPGKPVVAENDRILSLRAFGGANGVGGNGGSIVNFRQPTGVETAVDLVAGNGGSLMNYGDIKVGAKNTVGVGGSITGVSLTGEAGRIDSAVAIKSYAPDFVDRVLLNGWGTLLTDNLGNVGVVAGEAGRVKDGVAGDGPSKNGSVVDFSARGIMSMVAGSVDRLAAIQTISNITTTSGTGVLGAYKNAPFAHSSETRVYYAADGFTRVSTPQLGGGLMDGAILTQANPDGLRGFRVFSA